MMQGYFEQSETLVGRVLLALAAAALLMTACGGGDKLHPSRADELDGAAKAWAAEIESLTGVLQQIVDESSSARLAATVRQHARELGNITRPLGEIDDADARYLRSTHGEEYEDIVERYHTEAQRVRLDGAVLQEIPDALEGVTDLFPVRR